MERNKIENEVEIFELVNGKNCGFKENLIKEILQISDLCYINFKFNS